MSLQSRRPVLYSLKRVTSAGMILNTTRSRDGAPPKWPPNASSTTPSTPPRDEAEGAGAHRVAGELRAAALRFLPRHDGGGVIGDQRQKGRKGPVQGDLHREIVEGANAADLGCLAVEEGLCPHDLLEHPRALPLRGPLEGELDVGRL